MINTIKENIKTIISTNVSEVQEIKTYPSLEFNGFPAIQIYLGQNENVFETSAENMRTYEFKIECFVSVANDINVVTEDKHERANRVMGDLIDSVINALDNNSTLGNTVEFLEATPSVWGYENIQNGLCLVSEIILRVHKSYQLI